MDITYAKPGNSPSRFPHWIESERLRFVGPLDVHCSFDEFYRFHSSEEAELMAEYNLWDRLENREQARVDMWDYMWDSWRQGSGAYYLILDSVSRDEYEYSFVGVGCIEELNAPGLPSIGIWLHPDVWGNRYAGEQARAFLTVMFEELGVEAVKIEVEVGNENSFKAFSRFVDECGGTYEGVTEGNTRGELFDECDDHVFVIKDSEFSC